MITVSKPQLWQFLTAHAEPNSGDDTYEQYVSGLDADQLPQFALTKDQFEALRDAQWDGELHLIFVGQDVSSSKSVGGDEICSIADDVREALDNGHTIITWYGDNAECLVASYDEDSIRVAE